MTKITISIRFFAMMREIVGKSRMLYDIKENISINKIIMELADKIPDLKNILFVENKINESLVFVLNSQTIESLQVILKDNDELTILPPSGGG